MSQHQATWCQTTTGPVLQLGARTEPLPHPVVEWMRGRDAALTGDAAADLITLETKLRAEAADLRRSLAAAEHTVASQRTRCADAQAQGRFRGRRERHAASAALTAAITRQHEMAKLLDERVALQRLLRDVVIELDPPSGVLREAANGWKRSSDIPPNVVVFGPEDNFLAVDTRRGHVDRGAPIIDGDLYGEQWRRDGDDDSPFAEPTDRSGPWRIGFIPRTGEIYASRRCGYLTQEVWLLGRDFEPRQAHEVLSRIQPRMREPNSLLLAAGVVHAAQRLHGNRHCVAPQGAAPSTVPAAGGTR